MTKKIHDLLIVGGTISTVANAATNTLYIAFILSLGMNAYQIEMAVLTAIGLIMGEIITKFPKLQTLSYNNFKSFLVIEAAVNIIVAIVTLLTGSAWIVFASAIVIEPFSKIQKIGVIVLRSEIPDRKGYDIKNECISAKLALAGMGIAFLLNSNISGSAAYAIVAAAEVINNIFYWKVYDLIQEYKKQ